MKVAILSALLLLVSGCASKSFNERFLSAIEKGDYYTLNTIVKSSNKKLLYPLREGDTPLHIAVKVQNFEAVQYLVEQGLYLHARNSRKSTPLHEASYCGYAEIVEYLIKKGASINAEERYNYTPLMLGLGKLPLSTIKMMVKNGARSAKNKSTINAALHSKNYDLLDFLIDQKFSMKKPYRFGMDSLTYAISLGDRKLVEYLFSKGARLESTHDFMDCWYMHCYDKPELINMVMENRISRKQYDSVTGDEFVYRFAVMKGKNDWISFFKYCGIKPARDLPAIVHNKIAKNGQEDSSNAEDQKEKER